MLFDSYIFIFCFLPITVFGFFVFTKFQKTYLAFSWLVMASLFFYAWWDPKYLILLLLSITVNYGLGSLLWQRAKLQKPTKYLLYAGISLNLLFLGYFKYTYFLISNLNEWLASSVSFEPLILPLGISFFTFQKIAFLVDASRAQIKDYRFLDYCLFVSFFPQLIAGPIVQHKQFIPQIENRQNIKVTSQSLCLGLTIFFMGLFKKIGLADGIAQYSNAAFNGAAQGVVLSFWEAWCGSFAYALQLYFDFSGYSDMAIGLAYIFGIKLPLNFYSPYKAKNIIDFWRRWHMTLSTFLRNYLYIPLGGSKRGASRRYVNLFLTMLLGGLWHGANWTFVLWGALHGAFLTINHFWRVLCETKRPFSIFKNMKGFSHFSHLVTLLAVVTAWVPFRAENIQVTKSILNSMYSFDNFSLPKTFLSKFSFLQHFSFMNLESKGMFYNGLAQWPLGLAWIVVLMMLALWVPNTSQIMNRYITLDGVVPEAQMSWWQWKPSTLWAALTAFIILLTFMLLSEESEFLYFQF